ncbi:MAG: hypothetical protein K6G56_08725 [Clostridiales bacterium]|nr:hypothetical protein [Clostridiales bacterium]
MRISLMLTAVSALLTAGGVLDGTRRRMGITKGKALFFLLCAAALSSFEAESEWGGIFPACVLIPAWVFGHTLARSERPGAVVLSLPLSALAGLLLYPLANSTGEWAIFAAGAVSGAVSFAIGMGAGLPTAALLPVFLHASAYVSDLISFGWGGLELAENCLSMQLAGLMLSVFAVWARSTVRTNVRILSAE